MHQLRGERYAKGARPHIVTAIGHMHMLSFSEAWRFYRDVVPRMSGTEQALLALNDRFYLLTVLCRRPDMIHPWLYERCREVESAPDGYIDLWARAHGKSSIITFAGVIQEILRNPEIRVAIFSHTKESAHHFIGQIKDELEDNEELIRLFPDVLWQSPAERNAGARSWSKEHGLTVKRRGNPREATVEGHGVIDTLPTGKHFGLLVYDDVITQDNVTNPEQMKKATERTELSFPLGEADGGRRWVIGTRYHFADTYAHLLEHGIATPRIYPATNDGSLNGRPVFLTPERWEEVKREQRSQVAAQYLQNPIAGDENTFRTRWLIPYWTRPITQNVYIAGDPSMGRGKSADRTAIAAVGIDTGRNRYLLDGYCHRMPLSERWEHLRDLQKKWSGMPGVQLVKVGWERYGMQADIEYFQERMRIENYWFEIHEVNWVGERPGGQSKKARVERMEPAFRNGSFLVPGRVWHPGAGNAESHARWFLEEGSDEIRYRPCSGLHAREREAKATSEHWRLFEPIMRRNEDDHPYDLTRTFFEEFALFPFSPRDDLVDAMSRVWDLDPQPAVKWEQIEPEDYADS